MEIIPSRVFSTLYIYIDIAWLIIFLVILLYFKKYLAVFAGLISSALYFIIDFGIFYLLLDTRVVHGVNPAILLLWLSISYGFTNFVWIWLWLDRDSHAFEWSFLIISGWFTTALLSQNFGNNLSMISIQRGTSSYHGAMALILFIGYALLIIMNIKNKILEKKINIIWILTIGILVQLSWESVLLITGIRATNWMPLVINSLLETNLGLPYLFLIHRAVTLRYREDLKRCET
ncbi:MAG: hypothetical protein ACYCXK_01240 [Candidatus Humimicrobiaceae bacterium]